jgi:hypothetical protein
MVETANPSQPSTPEASAAPAQTREAASTELTPDRPPTALPGEGTDFLVGPGVTRAVHGRPYERTGDDPVYRPLRIFT